jgi:hypothetical protein
MPEPEKLVIEMLPAEYGECLWVECRRGSEVHRLLIDGGTPGTAGRLLKRIQELPGRRPHFDILAVSHIDADHIGGIVGLIEDEDFGAHFADIWFNGFQHLPKPTGKTRDFQQGETLTAALTGRVTNHPLPWNKAFSGKAVARPDDHPKTGKCLVDPPVYRTEWGLQITLLSPTTKRLISLSRGWNGYLQKLRAGESSLQTYQPRTRGIETTDDLEKLAAVESNKDATAPNGSSIAFLLEFGGHSCLFAADAFATVLYPALSWIARSRGLERLEIDAFKLPHHGSRGNVLSPLFDVVRAKNYLVSTSGARFEHPDDEAIARVITLGGPGHTIWFNYSSPQTLKWAEKRFTSRYEYGTEYPKSAAGGVTLELS